MVQPTTLATGRLLSHSADGRVARRDIRGLTLVEVALVLVLLVVLASLAWPVVDSAFSYARLRTAGDQVRVAWARARLSAMRSGHIHAFRYELDGMRWQVEVQSGLPTSQPTAATTTPTTDTASGVASAAALDAQQLVGESRFPSSSTAVNRGNSAIQSPPLETRPASNQWSEPILFLPDGTTSNASVELRNDRGATVRVVLRGLTGIARVLEKSAYVSTEN